MSLPEFLQGYLDKLSGADDPSEESADDETEDDESEDDEEILVERLAGVKLLSELMNERLRDVCGIIVGYCWPAVGWPLAGGPLRVLRKGEAFCAYETDEGVNEWSLLFASTTLEEGPQRWQVQILTPKTQYAVGVAIERNDQYEIYCSCSRCVKEKYVIMFTGRFRGASGFSHMSKGLCHLLDEDDAPVTLTFTWEEPVLTIVRETPSPPFKTYEYLTVRSSYPGRARPFLRLYDHGARLALRDFL